MKNLDLAVRHFTREARVEGFDTSDGAEGCCEIASRAFLAELERCGVEGRLRRLTAMELEDYPIFTDGCCVHYIVEAAGLWFDWTARQFHPKAPFPAVLEES